MVIGLIYSWEVKDFGAKNSTDGSQLRIQVDVPRTSPCHYYTSKQTNDIFHHANMNVLFKKHKT